LVAAATNCCRGASKPLAAFAACGFCFGTCLFCEGSLIFDERIMRCID
jgi:hypothetical protein